MADSGSELTSYAETGSCVDSDGESDPGPKEVPRILANYHLEKVLGSGYSGSIYRAKHIYQGNVVALKIQDLHHECPTNRFERHFYPLLQGGKGMPRMYASGTTQDWDWLAIDLLGSSLDQLFRASRKDTMDIASVCSIAMQVIARLETMHARGVLHRDIQLGNCVIGLPPHEKTIYMIDFGFSKQYIDPYTRRHIPDSRVKRDFIGNYWFSSINVHCKGRVPSRRDDLEAAALMFIHLLTPRGLPWTRNGVPKESTAHDLLIEEKRNARPQDLCRGLPVEFEDFLRYTRKLKFEECPDYETWIDQFKQLKIASGYSGSEDLEWPPKPPIVRKPITMHTPLRARAAPVVNKAEMEGILNGLAKLSLHPVQRAALVDPRQLQPAARVAAAVAEKPSHQRKTPASRTSSRRSAVTESTQSRDTQGSGIQPTRWYGQSKAAILSELCDKVGKATNNVQLASLVKDFVIALQLNSSRTLTRQALAFLDVLQKQLVNPSVFVQPTRTKRHRSADELSNLEPARSKLGVVARLRYEVRAAPSNAALGGLVSEFTKVTNKSVGRTITKDGFVFLEGVANRLVALG